MPGEDYEPERAWDEYQWERFLQQQDHKTEQYMELLEKYLDDPQRDQLIAQEMGWRHLESDWNEEVLSEESPEDEERTSNPIFDTAAESFEEHSLYRAAFALTVWLDQLFDENRLLQNEPGAVKLATHAALASAKLAAALSGEDADELGMTIAYLKRSLRAITISMETANQLLKQKAITPPQYSILQQRLFQVRDGIIALMGDYRGEWRRRFGNS